jgi:SAM-dependent methyltransferase
MHASAPDPLPSLGYTLAFVNDALPATAQRILEVGCGTGELAAALKAQGLLVVAIDADPDCVAAARKAGVDARTSEWPTQIGTSFDAVLFTRSLHHIRPLGEAVESACEALTPGGKIIVEDFRAEGGDAPSKRWFASALDRLQADGVLTDQVAKWIDDMVAPDHHDHDLHSSQAIATALARAGSLEASDSAYYFRYAEPHLPTHHAAALLDEECRAIADGRIHALGRRFVVTPRS